MKGTWQQYINGKLLKAIQKWKFEQNTFLGLDKDYWAVHLALSVLPTFAYWFFFKSKAWKNYGKVEINIFEKFSNSYIKFVTLPSIPLLNIFGLNDKNFNALKAFVYFEWISII